MANLFLPTEKTIKGPWLIGSKELEELAATFHLIVNKLKEANTKDIEDEALALYQNKVDKTYEDGLERAKTKIKFQRKITRATIVDYDGKKIVDDNLFGILKDPLIKEIKPKELLLLIEIGDNEFSLHIKSGQEENLTYSLKSSRKDIQEDCAYEIEKWVEQNQSDKATIIWSEISGLIRVLSLIVGFMLAFYVVKKVKPDYQNIYEKQISTLIDQKITKENQEKSIELLLKYIINYKGEDAKEITVINWTIAKICLVLFLIFLTTLFTPYSIIGIGRAKSSLARVRIYKKFIYGIPAAILLPLVIDFIMTFFRK